MALRARTPRTTTRAIAHDGKSVPPPLPDPCRPGLALDVAWGLARLDCADLEERANTDDDEIMDAGKAVSRKKVRANQKHVGPKNRVDYSRTAVHVDSLDIPLVAEPAIVKAK